MKNTITTILSATAIIAASLCSPQADAAVVSYDFTAKINDLFEYDGTTKVITHVATSNFPGSTISLADTVSGKFFYDTTWALHPYYQPEKPVSGTYLMYTSGAPVSAISFSVGGAAIFDAKDSASVQIANNASTFNGSDIFYLGSSTAYNGVMHQNANIALFDRSGSAFQSGDLPTQLNLADFSYRQLGSAWLRYSNGDQLQMSATLTSITPTVSPVPEPDAAALFGGGLALLLMLSFRRNRR